jgi:hypothetical protein
VHRVGVAVTAQRNTVEPRNTEERKRMPHRNRTGRFPGLIGLRRGFAQCGQQKIINVVEWDIPFRVLA